MNRGRFLRTTDRMTLDAPCVRSAGRRHSAIGRARNFFHRRPGDVRDVVHVVPTVEVVIKYVGILPPLGVNRVQTIFGAKPSDGGYPPSRWTVHPQPRMKQQMQKFIHHAAAKDVKWSVRS